MTCDDIDECSLGITSCSHLCVNTIGSFFCECYTGYYLSTDGSCIDIDECLIENGGCSHQCINGIGSYVCICTNGYELSGDSKTCNDINECTLGITNCSQLCVNAIGSFFCNCYAGYYLSSNNITCYDIDECILEISGCTQLCTNTIGSYSCSCVSGYRLSVDSKTCQAPPHVGFTAPGGLEAMKLLISKLKLPQQSIVLDIGCGLGGAIAYFGKDFSVNVSGIVLPVGASESLLLTQTTDNLNKGQLCINDVLQMSLPPPNYYDIIYIRETFGSLDQHLLALNKFETWIKPRGQIMMSDYCTGVTPLTKSFAAFLDNEQLNPINVNILNKTVQAVGLEISYSEDLSAEYIGFINEDIAKFHNIENLVKQVSQRYTTTWESVLYGLESGQMRWIVFVVTKL
eukprot:Em0007g968a